MLGMKEFTFNDEKRICSCQRLAARKVTLCVREQLGDLPVIASYCSHNFRIWSEKSINPATFPQRSACVPVRLANGGGRDDCHPGGIPAIHH